MKKKLILLLIKYKKIIFCVLIFKLYFLVSSFFYDTNFCIYNNINYDILYKKIEISSDEDPGFTSKEIRSMRIKYKLRKNKKAVIRYDKEYWKKNNRKFEIDILSIDGKYLFGNIFVDKPAYPNQKPSCSFKIEVYSDRTVVTPTYKRFCKKPMYYHENFDPYNPAHQPKSY